MSTLPDEILSEILSPALKISNELFSDTYDVSLFANPCVLSSSAYAAYLLVCRDWLRVATPLLYNVVILRSLSQANALERVLQKHKEFG
ncbi:hypothetical protein DFH06DRAFT_447200, partial [Mycena polygramma]